MRHLLLIAAVALGSLPANMQAQTPQPAWSFTIPVQVANALVQSVNVGCVVFWVNANGESVLSGSGSVTVPLDANGNASTTVTVNVPNTSGNPYDATDYRCSLAITNPKTGEECRPQMGDGTKTGECIAKPGTEFIPVVQGKVK